MTETLQKALRYYHSVGIEAFPGKLKMGPDEKGRIIKIPILPKWKETIFTQEAALDNLKNWHNAVALKTGRKSGIWVLDVDTHDVDGFATLAQIGLSINGDTPCESTQGNGKHFFFAFPANRTEPLTTSQKKLGLDSRGDGGLIFAAPSRVIGGGEYKLLVPIKPDRSNLREPPAALLDFLFPQEKTQPGPAPAPEPHRSGALTSKQLAWWEGALRECAAETEDRSGADFSLLCTAVKLGIDQEDVWCQVEHIGKFADRGRSYFDSTWLGAEKVVTPSQRTRKRSEPRKPIPRPTPVSIDGLDVRETDAFSAEYFVKQFGHDLRYDHIQKTWLNFEGTRWAADSEESIIPLGVQSAICMRDLANNIGDQKISVSLFSFARRSENHKKIKDMLSIARAMPGIATVRTKLDIDPLVFNCENGTLHLHGKQIVFKPHAQSDMLTKRANCRYEAGADCPRWIEFVNWCACGDLEIVGFLARFLGVCLTGEALQHIVFMHGPGLNGKSVLVSTVARLMGDYCVNCDFSLMTADRTQLGASPDIARLCGARIALCSEVPSDAKFNEQITKTLSGGDRLTARYLNQNPFEFDPTHKIVFAGNHRPMVRSGGQAFWRRLILVPFLNIVEPEKKRDLTELVDEFMEESPGLLNWLLAGLSEYRRGGLQIPDRLKSMVREYANDEDSIGDFILTECEQGSFEVAGSALATRWKDVHGDKKAPGRWFYEALREHGFESRHGMNGVVFSGIGLKERANSLQSEPGWA